MPLPQRFLEAVDRFANPRAQLYKVGGVWRATSAQQMLQQVAALAHALSELGVGPGDRVGLFAPNRPEWHIVDFAVLGLGAVDVPIYFNEAPDRIVYILNDSGAKVVVAIGEEQVQRLLSVRERLVSVEHIIVGGTSAEIKNSALRYEALVAQVSKDQVMEYRRWAAQVRAEQLASLLYTSGTTGEPKGVMLTHNNFSSNATDVLQGMKLRARNDVGLSFLPLSHVYERLIDYTYLFNGVTVAYVDRVEALPTALLEVRPTLMAAVPRVFEKIYTGIQERAAQTTGLRRNLFDWAVKVARQAVPWRGYGKSVSPWVKLQWWLANWLVYPKIRAALGGRIRRMNSGAAPIARELLEFFWAVGVKIYQGYGLTETSPVISTNHEQSNRLGSVGRPIPNVEVRIAEDGEILVRGPCVMQGYYNKPDQTREAFTEDGWFKTGDIGWLDEDGYLYVTDRKKDLIKTAAGKFVAPQPIENRLKTSPYIANAVVVGDRHKFVVALLVPNFVAIEARAREHGLQFSSRAELAAHPWVRQLLEQELDRLTADFAQYERPKRFAVLDHDFSFDGGQLTYTMKLKRRVIEQRYAEQIAALYADVEEPRPA